MRFTGLGCPAPPPYDDPARREPAELPENLDEQQMRRDVRATLIAIPLWLIVMALLGLFHLLTQ